MTASRMIADEPPSRQIIGADLSQGPSPSAAAALAQPANLPPERDTAKSTKNTVGIQAREQRGFGEYPLEVHSSITIRAGVVVSRRHPVAFAYRTRWPWSSRRRYAIDATAVPNFTD